MTCMTPFVTCQRYDMIELAIELGYCGGQGRLQGPACPWEASAGRLRGRRRRVVVGGERAAQGGAACAGSLGEGSGVVVGLVVARLW